MSRIRSVSKLELQAKDFLLSLDWKRLRHQPKGIYGNPDFANKAKKIAVFIHGCFFHGCKEHFKLPKSNSAFWKKKIQRNWDRHFFVEQRLKEEGWKVMVFWEHEIRRRQ